MEKQTDELMKYLLSTLKDTVEFSKEQAPEVARQMLELGRWEALTTAYWGIFWAVGAIVWALIILWFARKCDDGDIVGFILVPIAAFFFGIYCFVSSYSEFKKIEIAPKVYLIEKVTKP
jgi:hypothetical protein